MARRYLVIFLIAFGVTAAARIASAADAPMARILWLEPVDGGAKQAFDDERKAANAELPVYRTIKADDPRLKDYERWVDTEPARLARRLVYIAASRFGDDPIFREPVLPIVIKKDGNHGERGFALQTATGEEKHPSVAYVILDPNPDFLGNTILHECAHVIQTITSRGRRDGSAWTAFPHTTFAVSDPITALAEGYAIHFETLTGHYAKAADRREFYQRLSPAFEAGKGVKAAFFLPVVDPMTFAQVWARYQSVRDMTPAFEGHIYPGEYGRTQMDPARDMSRLKNPNAMLASEGVAASVIFWAAAGLAAEKGAVPAGGLDQPGIIEAETMLLEAVARLSYADTPFRPDLLDFVQCLGQANQHAGEIAISRFVDVTRGVTARPTMRAEWRKLYTNAIMLDIQQARSQIAQMDVVRGDIAAQARRDFGTLRAGVGPVIPVRLKDAAVELKAFGRKMPVQFDLNAMSEPELRLIAALDAESRTRIESERERAPFASIKDFESRTRLSAADLGLAEIAERR